MVIPPTLLAPLASSALPVPLALTTPHDASALERAHGALAHALEWAVLAVNAACAFVLLFGVVVGLVTLARIQLQRGCDPEVHWPILRRRVGRYILFGLELLIAADIIETMAQPTLEQLALLGGVSVLRIATGYALAKELESLPHAGAPVGRDETD